MSRQAEVESLEASNLQKPCDQRSSRPWRQVLERLHFYGDWHQPMGKIPERDQEARFHQWFSGDSCALPAVGAWLAAVRRELETSSFGRGVGVCHLRGLTGEVVWSTGRYGHSMQLADQIADGRLVSSGPQVDSWLFGDCPE